MNHAAASEHLPDLLIESDVELLGHVRGCHHCQQRLFRLQRVQSLLQQARRRRGRSRARSFAVAVAAIAADLVAAL